MKSKKKPKSTAAAKTVTATATEIACISIPRRASTEMIMMSATVATIIHVLGSDLQRCRRSRTQ